MESNKSIVVLKVISNGLLKTNDVSAQSSSLTCGMYALFFNKVVARIGWIDPLVVNDSELLFPWT